MVIKFIVDYQSGCSYSCQLNNGNTLRTALYTLDAKSIIYSSVDIYSGTVLYLTQSSIRWIRTAYISLIRKKQKRLFISFVNFIYLF